MRRNIIVVLALVAVLGTVLVAILSRPADDAQVVRMAAFGQGSSGSNSVSVETTASRTGGTEKDVSVQECLASEVDKESTEEPTDSYVSGGEGDVGAADPAATYIPIDEFDTPQTYESHIVFHGWRGQMADVTVETARLMGPIDSVSGAEMSTVHPQDEQDFSARLENQRFVVSVPRGTDAALQSGATVRSILFPVSGGAILMIDGVLGQ